MRSLAIPLCALAATGCPFVEDLPDNATLYCTTDDDCSARQRCDVAHHLCIADGAAVDATAPEVTGARFVPNTVSIGASPPQLILDLAHDEDLQGDPLVLFAGPTLPLSADHNQPGHVFAVLIDEETPDARYTVDSVTVRDDDGNEANWPITGASLLVDRVAPDFFNVLLSGQEGASDLAPHNVVGASFIPSDVLRAAPTFSVGNASSACVQDIETDATWRCAVQLAPGDVVDGPNPVQLSQQDLAGNDASYALSIDVDAAAPALIDEATTVQLLAPDGTPALAAHAGGTLRVALVFDEDVLAPALIANVPGGLTFDDVVGVGRRWIASVSVPPGIPDGDYDLQIAFQDVAGHTASRGVTLGAPFIDDTVPFIEQFQTDCAPPGQRCADLDGDDHAGITEACPDGDDCDDTDPLTFLGAIPLPGDGRNNECGGEGESVPISSTIGVFVDSTDGLDESPDGSELAPVRSLDRAQQLAQETGRNWLFLRGSFDPYTYGPVTLTFNTLGSLEVDADGTWSRSGGPVRSRLLGGGLVATANVVDSVDVDGACCEFQFRGRLLARVHALYATSIESSALVVDSTFLLANTIVSAGNQPVRIVSSQLRDLTVRSPTLVHRSLLQNALLDRAAAALWATSSVFDNTQIFDATVRCAACASVNLFHSSIIAHDNVDDRPALLVTGSGATVLVGNILMHTGTNPAVQLQDSSGVILVANDLVSGSGGSLQVGGADVALDAINACAFTGCSASSGNLAVNPLFDVGDPGALADGTPLRDQGADPIPFGAPSSVAADIDGECRYDDLDADIGPDELHP